MKEQDSGHFLKDLKSKVLHEYAVCCCQEEILNISLNIHLLSDDPCNSEWLVER